MNFRQSPGGHSPSGMGLLGIDPAAFGSDPVQWGDLRAKGRPKGVARASQLNRLRRTQSGRQRVDFGNGGTGWAYRDGDQVRIEFDNGMRALGRFVDPPGQPEMYFTDLQFSGPYRVRSAPTRIRVYTPPSGRLYAEYDRSLIVDTPFRQTRAIVDKTGIFALDD